MRKKKRKKFRPKLNIFKITSIFLVGVFLLLSPVFIKKMITIKRVECISQYGQCPENIESVINQYLPSDYKNLKPNIEKILDENYLVGGYLIQYKIPDTLLIEIVAKKEKFAILDNTGTFYKIDNNGFILSIDNQNNLPFVSIKFSFNKKPGDKIDDTLLNAVKLNYMIGFIINIDSSNVVGKSLYIKPAYGPLYILPLDRDVKPLSGAVRLIYSRLNQSENGIRIEDVKEIDLRYKNPIIR